MHKLNINRTGIAVAGFLAGFHFFWAFLVASGWAQPVMDFIMRLHMIKPFYVIAPFDVTLAASLIAFTAASGYAIGIFYAWIWNRLHR